MSARKVLFQLFVIIICCGVFFFARRNMALIRERKIYQELNNRLKHEKNQTTEINNNNNNSIKHTTISTSAAVDDYKTKMTLEYPNLCYTIQIFYVIANDYQRHEIDKTILNDNVINGNSNPVDERKLISNDEHNSLLEQQLQRNQPQHKKVDNIHGSNSIIYVFVLFLIVSLIRAALDISKHFNKDDKNKDDFSRRTSLQEFAQSRHSRKNSKKKAISRQESTITPVGSPIMAENSIISNLLDNPSQFLLNKIPFGTATKISTIYTPTVTTKPHIANIISNNSSIDRSESGGSPAKIPNKILGARPAPMMRRQSVPCAVGQSIFSNTYGSLARRPSMDSFSEGDSSPDVKRRVRMIHRH